jgi:hypothetical protein
METKSNPGSSISSDKEEANLSQEEIEKQHEEEQQEKVDRRIREIEKQFSNDSDVNFGDEEIEKPTFTNEVVIIRPQIFYENEEAHKDNKFMKYSGMEKSDTNAEVTSNYS